MKDFQERVTEEKMELDEKLGRLTRFIESDNFKNVLLFERRRLQRQECIMSLYAAVLTERIDAF